MRMQDCIRALAALTVLAAGMGAQQPSPTGSTPIARRAADIWNLASTTRANGRYSLADGRTVEGNVAVLNGPATIAGTIRGSLVAINADVRLARGARIERDLIVIGGTVTGQDSASLDGEVLQQAELLRYHLDADRIEIEREPQYDDTWWRRRRFRRNRAEVPDRGEGAERRSSNYSFAEFPYVASRTYNRLEGWSFVVGPRMERMRDWGGFTADLYAVARTAQPMRWERESVGHDARAEVLFGRPIGVAIGAQAFDVVQPTEEWQLGEGEVGLASALLRRDYRDYYVRHGAQLYVRFVAGRDVSVSVGLSDEDWSNRMARNPWSLSNGSKSWRPNPLMDEGQVHLLTTRLLVDTRARERSPFGGWYVRAEVEQGSGRLTRWGAPVIHFAAPTPEEVWYARTFVDLRRYNRIAPGLSLDLRAVIGGWIAGDPLPTQRRLGVDGPGALPGFDFRQAAPGADVLNCDAGIEQPGRPAQCDRLALAQAQLRSRFLFSSWRTDGDDDWWRPGFNDRTSWVLFADAGRGWMVDHAGARGNDPAYVQGNALPPLGSFKVDVGAGVDFGEFGMYWAKAMNNSTDDPVRFIVRLQRRF